MVAKRRALLALLLSALPLVYTVPLWQTGVLDQVENWLVDIRYRYFNPNHRISDKVVVLDLDESTFRTHRNNAHYGPWPWPRSSYRPVIDYVVTGAPRLVLFDIFFTNFSPDDEQMEKLNQSWPVLSHAIFFERDEVQRREPVPPEMMSHTIAVDGADRLRAYEEASFPTPRIGASAPFIHSVSHDTDPDGVTRRMHHFFRHQGQVFPSLSLRAFGGTGKITGSASPSEIRVRAGDRELRIPASEGQVPLHYYSCPELKRFELARRVAAGGVIESVRALEAGEVTDFSQLRVPAEAFKDRYVIVGVSAPAAHDIKRTVCGDLPGTMLHVIALSNLLEGHFARPWPSWSGMLIALFLLPITSIFVVLSNRLLIRILLPVSAFAVFLAGSFILFKFDEVVWMAQTVVSVPVAFLTALGYLTAVEGREKSRFHAAMGKYLSPEVLDEVMSKGALRAEVGERRNITVLFSDIRGFTTISEKQDAASVVGVLNEYFSEMVAIIFHNNGTLDKFIGDAIMAFWGAPVFRADHAARAVRAALEMTAALRALNASFHERGIDPLGIGIGLNTGEMIVGNIGSDQRLDYTIIGDNVNLGSRLEGLTKEYGVEVIASESTVRELGGAIPCRLLDLVAVKGKAIPVAIYEPLSEPSSYTGLSLAEVAHQFEAAFGLYRSRKWEGALAAYTELNRIREGGDRCARLMMERIRLYQTEAPPQQWDGAFVMKTK